MVTFLRLVARLTGRSRPCTHPTRIARYAADTGLVDWHCTSCHSYVTTTLR